MKQPKKTCFVIMGYGIKMDYSTGRQLDLDKTYENIILPVCKSIGLNCFRAKDVFLGASDKPMYEWIYKADIVIADISTVNANAIYELGVRHALKPYSTIVISENQLKYPFDVNHTVIDPYEHLGKDIAVSEAKRFQKELKLKICKILNSSTTDSPVYTYLPDLQPPKLLKAQKSGISTKTKSPSTSISELTKDAEDAKNRGDYILAEKIIKAALHYDENNIFLIQRLVLVTYKSEKPNKITALNNALKITKTLNPDITTDPETLGLCGAIYKRLHEETNDINHLYKSLSFYERGFYILQDYYNGINVAYLNDQLASLSDEKNTAIYHIIQAQKVREKVISYCKLLLISKTFKSRSDSILILQTIYEALLGNNKVKEAKSYLQILKKESKGKFDLDTFVVTLISNRDLFKVKISE